MNRSRFRYTTSRCVALKNVVDNSRQSGDASRVSKHTARSCQAPLSCQAVEVTKKNRDTCGRDPGKRYTRKNELLAKTGWIRERGPRTGYGDWRALTCSSCRNSERNHKLTRSDLGVERNPSNGRECRGSRTASKLNSADC